MQRLGHGDPAGPHKKMSKWFGLNLMNLIALSSFCANGFQNAPNNPTLRRDSNRIDSDLISVPSYRFQLCSRAIKLNTLRISVATALQSSSKECNSNLIAAVKNSDCRLVGQLLEQGADSNSYDDWGVSCLQLAVKNGKQDIAELLIRNGADVHKSDLDSETTSPLHTAAQYGNLGMVELLVRQGAGGLHFNEGGIVCLDTVPQM